MKREFFQSASDRLPAGMRPSPFTDRTDWLGQGDLTFAVTNGFPSTPGHTLVLPRDFGVYRFTELARDELAEHHRMLRFLTRAFNRHFKPDGYNIGWNVEFHGGQSIAHAHMHILPRYHAINKQHKINPAGGIAMMPFAQIPPFYSSRRTSTRARFEWEIMNQLPILTENDTAFAVQLGRMEAVTPGHTYILTRQKHDNILTCGEDEFVAQLDLALKVMAMQQCGDRPPQGYNLGWDVGAAAGQVLEQTYLQVIPRYAGDMDTPRGGIVRIIPQRAWPQQTDYYDKKNVGKDVALQDKVVFPFHFWATPGRADTIDLKKELGMG